MTKILFVYPNSEGYPIIPLAISTLSGILKYQGHATDLFDTTFLMPAHPDHEARIKTGQVVPVDMDKYWQNNISGSINDLFITKIKNFEPDIIAFTIVENTYQQAKELLSVARLNCPQAITVVGGLFPTIMPEFFVKNRDVDIICTGEGEHAMIELAEKRRQFYNCSNIPGLIVKNGMIYRNPPLKFWNWEIPAYQDWDIFDQRHLLKPFMGKVHRTGFFEMARGCPYKCAYCTNDLCQDIFKGMGKYNRQKPLTDAIIEMQFLKQKYNLDLVFFNDENFLTMPQQRFELFCQMYKNQINLPFFIMTRADSLLDEFKISALKEAGCVTIGIGVESGNENTRKHVLNKNISNDAFEQAFWNCKKAGIRTTANIMIGLPFENETDIRESAAFCRKIEADSVSLAIFAPYYGTKLRKICIDWGYMDDRYYPEIGIINKSILKMPQISPEKIEELYYKFNELVYG